MSFTAQPTASTAQPLVSVVLSIFNGMPYVLETLDSIRAQTYTNWEVVMCDNASTDGTVVAIERYIAEKGDSRLRLLHQKHTSVADDWNRSIGHAKGEYIKLMGCDDNLLPDCLETQVKLLQERPSVGFVSSGKDVIDSTGRKYLERRPLKEGEYTWDDLGCRAIKAVVNLIGEPVGVTFRRDLFFESGAYSEEYRYFIDLELLLRLLRRTNLYITGRPLYQFRTHSTSLTSTTRDVSLEEYARILDLYADDLKLRQSPMLKSYLVTKARLIAAVRSMVMKPPLSVLLRALTSAR